jgi:hypothetical protein
VGFSPRTFLGFSAELPLVDKLRTLDWNVIKQELVIFQECLRFEYKKGQELGPTLSKFGQTTTFF